MRASRRTEVAPPWALTKVAADAAQSQSLIVVEAATAVIVRGGGASSLHRCAAATRGHDSGAPRRGATLKPQLGDGSNCRASNVPGQPVARISKHAPKARRPLASVLQAASSARRHQSCAPKRRHASTLLDVCSLRAARSHRCDRYLLAPPNTRVCVQAR